MKSGRHDNALEPRNGLEILTGRRYEGIFIHTNKVTCVVDCEALPALIWWSVVRTPAVCDDRCLLVYVSVDDVQRVGASRCFVGRRPEICLSSINKFPSPTTPLTALPLAAPYCTSSFRTGFHFQLSAQHPQLTLVSLELLNQRCQSSKRVSFR